ncbi:MULTISPECIES: RDD family protein [Anaerococcus]|uniref:RDD family protein n=2 Tax=Anaerococcus vaginalis TaxID=33037 RepID=C7HW85_9FIRM|nr:MULTISPECIES: RDD family protein [Anaerococcus]EEU11968.1 RDD family protein [Anaerococcus vaginalis ATCC 51170]MDD7766688.1 RDD family protein [Anaerococcus vaginalis]MDU5461199.1 RDD family protein [Anaerococcus vaginalis]MDU5560064.1 RDD family protein [Anaerococcus vaginalis]MDY6127653.1 RDD family protein [Anaerococcus sp.]
MENMETIENNSLNVQKTISIPQFAYAGFFLRLVAFTIDSIVAYSFSNIIMKIFQIKTDLTIMNIEINPLIETGICLLYFFILTYLNKGQTLGKMAMGIRVISLNDEKLSFFDCLVREVFARYIQNFIKILYLIIGFSPNKQSLADMLVDTVVIKDDVVDYLFEN